MLTHAEVNAIWALLDRAGTELSDARGGETFRQSEVIDAIVRRVSELGDGAWTREQILEAWMHQAIGFIHRTTGLIGAEKMSSEDCVAAWNAIARAEIELGAGREAANEKLLTTIYFDEVIDAVRRTNVGARLSREQLFRAWVIKGFADRAIEATGRAEIDGRGLGRTSKPPVLS